MAERTWAFRCFLGSRRAGSCSSVGLVGRKGLVVLGRRRSGACWSKEKAAAGQRETEGLVAGRRLQSDVCLKC